MFNRDKPLFSRPVLAIIVVASTLAIWLLNLTAPKVDLPVPSVSVWQTESGVPVTWITQKPWQNGNKLSLSFVFRAPNTNQTLTATTLAMLAGPSLPLSTATINQRLTPLAAEIDTFFTEHHQFLNVTMSDQKAFLKPSLTLLDTWLNETQFKATALQRFQRQQRPDLAQQQLLQQLFPTPAQRFSPSIADITLLQLDQYLEQLKSNVDHIVIAGVQDDQTQVLLKENLNILTSTMKPSSNTETATLAQSSSMQTIGDGELSALYGAIGVSPLNSVEDWLALQIWARDMIQHQKDTLNTQTSKWQLHLASPEPYVSWQVLIPTSVLQESESERAPLKSSWFDPMELESLQDKKRFYELKQQLLERLSQVVQESAWWAQFAAQTTNIDTHLTLKDFAQHYSEAANSFTIEQYQQHLNALLQPSSRQEVQVQQ